MQHRGTPFLLAATVLLLPACESPLGARTDNSELKQLPRQLATTERDVIQASNSFAFDVLRETLRDQPADNVLLSPLSASLALGMTTNGARGETQDEMRAVLGFRDLTMHEVNASYRGLIDLLLGLDRNVDMRIANSVWARAGFPFHQAFYDTVAKYFDAAATSLDFSRSDAASVINGWIRTNTGGHIDRIVPDPIPPAVVMYLVNAVYFKAAWRHEFDLADTRDAPFRRADGTQKTVPLMQRQAPTWHHYDALTGVQIVEAAYGRGAFAMTLVLPPAGSDIDTFIASLDEARWRRWTDALNQSDVLLRLPRFRVEYMTRMNEPLVALGMGRAFGRLPGTDFTGMSPLGRDLYISNVIQKTYIDVTEEGTEAAAATVVEMSRTSSAVTTVTFDRPFVIAIRERFSGAILFLGKIGNP